MIFHRIDGTTKEKFKIGKNGPRIADAGDGTLEIEENDGTIRAVGISSIRNAGISTDIPDKTAVLESVNKKIRTMTEAEALTAVGNDSIEGDYFYIEK